MKIMIKDRKRGNSEAGFKRLNSVTEKSGAIETKSRTVETKSCKVHSVEKCRMSGIPPTHTHMMHSSYENGQGLCMELMELRLT